MPKGLQGFQPGNQIALGNKGNKKGRKGYEYEEAQLKKMRKLFSGILSLGEKIYSGEADKEQVKRFELLLKLNLKICDKLHASKQHLEGEMADPITEVEIVMVDNRKPDVKKLLKKEEELQEREIEIEKRERLLAGGKSEQKALPEPTQSPVLEGKEIVEGEFVEVSGRPKPPALIRKELTREERLERKRQAIATAHLGEINKKII